MHSKMSAACSLVSIRSTRNVFCDPCLHGETNPASLAWVYIALGEKGQAFARLELYAEHLPFMGSLKIVQVVDPIRSTVC